MQKLWQIDEEMTSSQQQELEKQNIFIVESIITHRTKNGQFEYNVTWEGYDDVTWEPVNHLPPHMVQQYWITRGVETDPAGFIEAIKYLSQQKLIDYQGCDNEHEACEGEDQYEPEMIDYDQGCDNEYEVYQGDYKQYVSCACHRK